MAPELPGDPGEDDLPTPQILVLPMGSDDSDIEDDDAYRGYQPLSIMDDTDAAGGARGTYGPTDDEAQPHMQAHYAMEVEMEQDEGDDEVRQNGDIVVDLTDAALEVTHGDPNMPHVESVDAEIERQVWCEPRPQELQIELDNAKTEQILSAMASFTLPNMAVPEWAAGVPEERWKEELLQRIRQRGGGGGGATPVLENAKK